MQTRHRRFAISAGDACRYPAEIAPIGAVSASTGSAFEQLASLLEPEETLAIAADRIPAAVGLRIVDTKELLQMVLPDDVPPPADVAAGVALLDKTNASPEPHVLASRRRREFDCDRALSPDGLQGVQYDRGAKGSARLSEQSKTPAAASVRLGS